MADATIICPLYNAEKEIKKLDESLQMQEGVSFDVCYVLTESDDDTELIMNQKRIGFKKIRKNEFSHSLTREKMAMSAKGKVLVFLTQDVEIKDKLFVKKLIEPVLSGEVQATYARQVTKYNNIEKYTREYNYPVKSFVVSKEDIEERGLKTFFFSDAAGAIDAKTFKELGGYDGKDLPISEDMYFAHKLIINGGKIKYVADAKVFHSHKFTFKELYERYKLTGKFMKMNPQIANYGVNNAGGGMAKYILKCALRQKNWGVICRYIPDMGARFVGMKVGKR